jgi:hypothetical protein
VSSMISFDRKLRAVFLTNYLKQCKVLHQIAFYQWRKQYVPTAKIEELEECWETQTGFAAKLNPSLVTIVGTYKYKEEPKTHKEKEVQIKPCKRHN